MGISQQSQLEGLVKFANNGEEAIKLCGNYKPELIFIDVNMPVMNGFQTTKAIRLRQREAKIIAFADPDENLINMA